MRSSQTLSLFSTPRAPQQRSLSFALSFLLHLAFLGGVAYVVVHQPHIRRRTERYAVRSIEFHENQTPHPKPKTLYTPQSAPAAPRAEANARAPKSATAPRMPQLAPGEQTLLQPRTPFHLQIKQEIPVPQAMIWTPEKAFAREIVPSRPQPQTSAEVAPSLEIPNEEIELASLALSATPMPAPALPTPAATTSPIRLAAPKAALMAPALSSLSSKPPTPAALLSISDLRMPEGKAPAPPINESLRVKNEGALGNNAEPSEAAGQGQGKGGDGDSAQAHELQKQGEEPRPGASKPEEQAQKPPAPPTPPAPPAPAAPSQPAAQKDAVRGASENPLTAERIELPKDGAFGLVVVGSSLEDRYPETSRLWGGRLAYTVYLHVGASKSWILQYTLPRTTEAANAGSVGRIAAPWPYNILRPNIPSEMINADALMAHGYISAEGRFENIEVVFPPDFEQKQFVIDSLSQWRLRPAMQDGKPIRVEALLIIPDAQ